MYRSTVAMETEQARQLTAIALICINNVATA
jgi:hypothetical protein